MKGKTMSTVVETWATLEEPFPAFEPIAPPFKAVPPPTRLTLEQALKVTAGRIFELIDGRIVYKMPNDKHADAQGRLGGKLFVYFDANPIGRVRTEYMLRLWPEDKYESRTPDLSVILNESFKEEEYGTRAPDLAIEIVSRYDRWTDLLEKAKLYLSNGSRVVWIVDPYQQAVVVLTPDDQRWVKDTLTCPELLSGFSIPIKDIFNWPAAK
jgi:Uma2 family endonuclease